MKYWFKKHIPTKQSIKKYRELKLLRPFLKASSLWSLDRDPVARGVAAGLAGAMIPGFQIFYAAILALFLRGNLPIALLFTLVTNPITVLPIIYFICFVGSVILGNGETPCMINNFQWNFSSFHGFWSHFSIWFLQFGKSFLAGVAIVSVSFAIIGYFGTILIWKIIIFLFYRKRNKKNKTTE